MSPKGEPIPPVQYIPASAGKDVMLKAIKDDGCCIIKGFLTPEEVKTLNAEVDPFLASTPSGSDWEDPKMAKYLGLHTKRFGNLVTHSKIFRHQIIEKDLMYEICDEVFSQGSGALYKEGAATYWFDTTHINEIGPGNDAQSLHRDQSQWGVFNMAGPNAPEANINFFCALTRFTEENGATRVRPGSHKWPDMSDFSADGTLAAEMEPGDCCVFTGKVVHGGGANRTQNETRRALAMHMNASYLTPSDANAFCVPREIIEDMSPRAQKVLGFRSQFPKGAIGLWGVNFRDVADYMGYKAPAAAVSA